MQKRRSPAFSAASLDTAEDIRERYKYLSLLSEARKKMNGGRRMTKKADGSMKATGFSVFWRRKGGDMTSPFVSYLLIIPPLQIVVIVRVYLVFLMMKPRLACGLRVSPCIRPFVPPCTPSFFLTPSSNYIRFHPEIYKPIISTDLFWV